MKKSYGLILLLILFIVIFIGVFFQTKKANEEVISFSDEIYLLVNDQLYSDNNPVIIENQTIYISSDTLRKSLDPALFYDDKEKMLILTNKKKVLRYKLEADYATINHRVFYPDNQLKLIHNNIYIPEDILTRFYSIGVRYFDETRAVVIEGLDSAYPRGEIIKAGANLRIDASRKAPIVLEGLPLNSLVTIFEEYEGWYKVGSYNGIIGYMEKEYLKITYPNERWVEVGKNQHNLQDNREKINLTWDYSYGKMNNIDHIEHLDGVNVLSPTWFSIRDGEGDIFDKGNLAYVKKFKELGYEIWPLIDNSFDPDLTHELLKSSEKREKLIYTIASLYKDYGVDGINIDFENVYLDDKDLLTQFVRELYPIFNGLGMKVSMDISPISTSENWSLSYDRARLAETVDYLILMAYDQHWASSPIAGSVAQYSWVEASILGLLEEVPGEQLVLAIPFYTRLWEITNQEGKEELTSYALSMENANKFIKEKQIELVWDENSRQYYGEVQLEDKLYKIWLEDKESISYKASLVSKYNLAGLASWRQGFETEDIWPVLSNSIIFN